MCFFYLIIVVLNFFSRTVFPTMEEEEEDDVIDRIRAKQKLNASHIVYVIELLIEAYNSAIISFVDPAFLTLYMTSKDPKPCADMMRYFKGDREKPITIIPVHDDDHWSLLIYVTRYNTFYYFDSLEEHHGDYVSQIIRKMAHDDIITEVRQTHLITMKSECQVHLYECGQYLFMFIYAFFIEYNNSCATPFDQRLQGYVLQSCRELHRQSFLRLLMAWIHEKRDY